jgi:hypothetical protein
MFYDPADELTKEEQEAIDPIMKLPILEQLAYEWKKSTFPDLQTVLITVVAIIVSVTVSSYCIYWWDSFLRELYTRVHLIPTAEEIAERANQLSGLDLPKGWMQNADGQGVDAVIEGLVPPPSGVGGSMLPDL